MRVCDFTEASAHKPWESCGLAMIKEVVSNRLRGSLVQGCVVGRRLLRVLRRQARPLKVLHVDLRSQNRRPWGNGEHMLDDGPVPSYPALAALYVRHMQHLHPTQLPCICAAFERPGEPQPENGSTSFLDKGLQAHMEVSLKVQARSTLYWRHTSSVRRSVAISPRRREASDAALQYLSWNSLSCTPSKNKSKPAPLLVRMHTAGAHLLPGVPSHIARVDDLTAFLRASVSSGLLLSLSCLTMARMTIGKCMPEVQSIQRYG